MTTQEKIEALEKEESAADDVVAEIRGRLEKARREQFRERHGYGPGDWVIFDGLPAYVVYGYSAWTVEYDHVRLKRITKTSKLSLRVDTVYRDLEKRIAPWPADRPLPEVKA